MADHVVRPSRWFFAGLVAAIALGPMSIQMFLPALPAIQEGFGVAAGSAQLALTVSMLAIGVATLIYGPASDRLGRRPVLLAGLLLYLVGSALCALAPDVATLVAGRAAQAAGGSTGMVLSRAIVRDAYPQERLAGVLAYLSVAMAFVPMLAPLMGGVLIDLAGWRAVFVFGFAAGCLTLGTALKGVTETHLSPDPDAGFAALRGDFARLLRSPDFRGYAFQGAFATATFFSFISAAPYLVIQVMGRPASEYGLYFAAMAFAFILGNLLTARYSERIGRDRMLTAACLGLVASGVLLLGLVAAGHWSPAVLFGPGALLVFSQGVAIPNSQAGAVSVDPTLAGAASGLAGFLQMAVASAFAQAVGAFQDDTARPMLACWLVASTLALVSLRIALWARGRRAAPVPGMSAPR